MSSESVSALGQPSETKPILGAPDSDGLAAVADSCVIARFSLIAGPLPQAPIKSRVMNADNESKNVGSHAQPASDLVALAPALLAG